jgi:hypothetical protein
VRALPKCLINERNVRGPGLRAQLHTNNVESYFSRLRRMVQGQHHFVSARHLHQYANEAAWKEDNRRLDNGSLAYRALGLALNHQPSRYFAGYWHRG